MCKILVFLLEEKSAVSFLEQITARLNLKHYYEIHFLSFHGKSDLEARLEKTIKLWNKPSTLFIIMRDADSGDCCKIKQNLLNKCNNSGKGDSCTVRIACKELESFYLGDLAAVGRAFSQPELERKQFKRQYRTPDVLGSPSQELKKLTNYAYSKVIGSRMIGSEITLDESNCSASFCVLLKTLLLLKKQMEEVV